MRVLVTGSRSWVAAWRVWADLWAAVREIPDGGALTVVHGDCPQGADRYARQWCEWATTARSAVGIREERYPADWGRHGRRAGVLRNVEMVSRGADVCYAYIRNHSRGATMTAQLAMRVGIPTIIRREP